MKKIIVMSVVVSAAFAVTCKKKEKSEPAEDPKVYCVYGKLNGQRSFYSCAATKSEADARANELINSNNVSEVIEKTKCSECQ